VSLAFAARRVFEPVRVGAYIVAQFAGAGAAAALAYAVWGKELALGASHPSPGVSPVVALGAEVVATLLLVIVILATADQGAAVGKQAAIAVGLAIAACGFAFGPLSGASMNPARSLAPQALAGSFGIMWIYVAGPLIGALLAVWLASVVLGPPTAEEGKEARGSG
jgi:aquaporin Z